MVVPSPTGPDTNRHKQNQLSMLFDYNRKIRTQVLPFWHADGRIRTCRRPKFPHGTR